MAANYVKTFIKTLRSKHMTDKVTDFWSDLSLPNSVEFPSLELNDTDLRSEILSRIGSRPLAEVRAFSDDFISVLRRLHRLGFMCYVVCGKLNIRNPQVLSASSLDYELKQVEALEEESKATIMQIIETDFLEPVYRKFEGSLLEKVKNLHLLAARRTVTNPFCLTYQNQKLISFLGWEEANLCSNQVGFTTTHWVSSGLSKRQRSDIHARHFDFLLSKNAGFFLASIFIWNEVSLNLFRKNGYLPLYAKVVPLC